MNPNSRIFTSTYRVKWLKSKLTQKVKINIDENKLIVDPSSLQVSLEMLLLGESFSSSREISPHESRLSNLFIYRLNALRDNCRHYFSPFKRRFFFDENIFLSFVQKFWNFCCDFHHNYEENSK